MWYCNCIVFSSPRTHRVISRRREHSAPTTRNLHVFLIRNLEDLSPSQTLGVEMTRITFLPMLEYLDILYIVLALCVLWFTLFLCFVLYQAALLMKRIHGLVDEMRVRVVSLEDSIIGMRRKFDGNIAMVSGIAEGIKKIIEALRSKNSPM